MNVIPGALVPIKLWADDVEAQAMEQVKAVSALPFVHHHVAVMADAHWGVGATVGSVLAMRKAIVPAAVGVDIGCGMCAVRTTLTASDLPDDLSKLRAQIERDIPVGFAQHGDDFSSVVWRQPHMIGLYQEHARLVDKTPSILQREKNKFVHQMGTLGGGNHFVELCLDEEQRVWIMLHSGSRNVGKVIAEVFIEKAKEEMERWHVTPPHPDLAYLPEGSPVFDDYWWALDWAQRYAAMNRKTMLDTIVRSFGYVFLEKGFALTSEAINCHHNYASRENHFGENVIVTRKGAVRARAGDLGIIPGSMGTRSYIVEGLGNPDSFHSCSHGAGRAMSRTAARKRFTVEDLAEQTKGIECRKDADVIDEIPGAYKDIDVVMANQADLVRTVHTLRQVLCVKG